MIKIGITMGDPAGIGPEILAKALKKTGTEGLTVIGDRWAFEQAGKVPSKLEFIDLKNVDRKKFAFGTVSAGNGKASLAYVDTALDLLRQKRIDGIVTCPVSKEAVSMGGKKFTGHTEYIAAAMNVRRTVMMLLNDRLKFSMATTHVPLKKVASAISGKELKEVFRITRDGLAALLGISEPRIAVMGLNPHASDNGLIGREETDVIGPAAKDSKIHGPLPADTAVSQALAGEFDCLVAMYHDQALIPLKITGAKSGVNLTLGLSFCRTSPLHGTAFDIAGKGIADASSLESAIRLCAACCQNLKKA